MTTMFFSFIYMYAKSVSNLTAGGLSGPLIINGQSFTFPLNSGVPNSFMKTDGTGHTSWQLVTKSDVGLGSVDNLSQAELFASPTMTGTTTVEDLVVTGTATYAEVKDLKVDDNFIIVNNGETGSGVTLGTAGLRIDRGTAIDYLFQFDEVTQTFRVGEVGDTLALAAREDSPSDGAIPIWNSSTRILDTANGLTATEVTQLKNINSVVIGNTQWGYLGGLDQELDTAATPQFDGQMLTGSLVFKPGGIGNNVSITATSPINPVVYNLPDVGGNASFLMSAGSQTVTGVKTFSAASNQIQLQAGTGNTISLNMSAPAASRAYTLPDAGADTTFAMLAGAQTFSGALTFDGATTFSGQSGLLYADGTTASLSLSDGQIPIGRTGLAPAAATISGTTNRVSVVNGSGTITLTTPQDIGTTSAVTFASMILGATTNQIRLGTTNTTTISAAAPAASRIYSVPDAGTNTSFVMAAGNSTMAGVKTFSSAPNLSSLTGATALYLDASKNIAGATLTNGQILIGSTGAIPVAATITGTTNRITVTNSAGGITLNGPQDLHTGAAPTFASETLTATSNQLIMGAGATITINAAAPAASRVYSIPDAGASTSFVMAAGNSTIGGVKTFSSAPNLSGLTANNLLYLDSSKNITGATLTNGQILVGSTGSAPVATTITGTTNRVSVAVGAGSIQLSTPQDLHTGATPTFASETLTATTNQLTMGTGATITINAAAPAASRIYSIPDALADASFVMSAGNSTVGGVKTFSSAPNLSSLTANTILALDSSKNIVSRALTNGQILIGSTGAAPVAATLTGTTNQVNVATGAGSITFSLPQSIATTSSPTFASETLTATTNQLVLGTTNTVTISAAAPAASRVITIPDVSADASVVLTEGVQTINGNKVIGGIPNFSALSGGSALCLSTAKNLAARVLNDGQMLLGSTGGNPVAGTITGTTNQIISTPGSGTLTLSLPQDIATTSAVTFASGTLTATTNQLVLGSGNTVTISAAAPAASRVITVPDVGASASVVLTEGTQTINGNKVFSGIPNFSALTGGSAMYLNTSKNLAVRALNDGQMLLGLTGGNPVAGTITGTTNQIVVTPGAGSLTLSLPQDIASGSTPAFTGLNLNGFLHYSTGTISQSGTTITGSGTTFTSAMAGGTLYPAAGQPVVIQTFNSATSLTAYASQTIAAGTTYTIIYSATGTGAVITPGGQMLLRTQGSSGSANMITGLALQTIGGGSSSYNIDISTYNTALVTPCNGRLQFADSNFGCDFKWYSKIPGAAANAMQELFRVQADKTVRTFNNILDTTTSGDATFKGIVTLTAVAANRPIFSNGSKQLVTSPPIDDGQLIIGRTGTTPTCASLTGTANQIIVTNGSGSITLSTPQDLATTSTPTFAGISTPAVAASGANDLRLNSGSTSNTVYIGHDRAATNVIIGASVSGASELHVLTNGGLTGFRVSANVVTTQNNTLDDGSGGAIFNNIKLATSGGTPTALSYYESWSAALFILGPWGGGTANMDIRVVQIGPMVTISWTNSDSPPFVSSALIRTQAGDIPSRFFQSFLPSQSTPLFVYNNGTRVDGEVQIDHLNGRLQWYQNGGNFTAGVCYIPSGYVTYIMQ